MIHDPDGISLHKGLRAAVVTPLALGGALATSTGEAAAYCAFAAFSTLVFADFRGDRRRVVRGYLGLTAVSTACVLVGSLAAPHVVGAAVSLGIVTFAVRLAGCLGGYAVAGAAPVLLAFVLSAVSVADSVPLRVAAWAVGCAIGLLAALVAPVRPALPVRAGIADRCHELAEGLRSAARGSPGRRLDVDHVLELREQLAASTTRPVTAARESAAMRELLDAVGRASLLSGRLHPVGSSAGSGAERDLCDATATLFESTAATLLTGAPLDPRPAFEALGDHRRALLQELEGASTETREAVAQAVAATEPLRITAAMSVAAATAATVVVDRDEPSWDDLPFPLPAAGAAAFLARARRTLAFHLHWSTSRFRNSIRAAVALTASLLIARIGGFDHGFWVVLGTFVVLRSSATDTRSTAVEALTGTLVGFTIAAPLALVVDESSTILWVALPVVAFLAAWAPGAIGLGTGQAAFTVFVVVLFNLVAPLGPMTAVVRLETVGIGAIVGVVAGFVFWPRGAETLLAPTLARHYRAAADRLRVIAAERLGTPLGPDADARARQRMIATRDQLREVYEDLDADRAVDVALAERAAALTPPVYVDLAAWSYRRLVPGRRPSGPVAGDRRPLEARTFEVETAFGAVADALESSTTPAWSPAPPAVATSTLVPASDDAEQELDLIWLAVWLDTIEAALAEAMDTILHATAVVTHPWWTQPFHRQIRPDSGRVP